MTVGYVISDLHLGGGDAEPALEDFHQDQAFVDLLTGLRRPGATLFINGDFIDFAQIPPYDTPAPRHLLWDEATSLKKLHAAREAHPACFTALAAFAEVGDLVIHAGNHDLDLTWTGVQDQLRTWIGGARLRFERRYSTFHGVLIEHGHEFTPENALEFPDIVTHEHAGRAYLERVWGTDFMLAFYNDLERKLRFADKAKPMLRVAYHGFRQRWIGGRELVRLVVFLKRRGIPWRGLASSVLAPEEAVDRVLDGVADDEWREMLEQRRADDPAFADEIVAAVAALPPEEQAIVKARGGVAVGIPPTTTGPAPSATLGLFRDGREERAARERLGRTGITHVVFGHTHEVVDGALDGALFNPGTWVPSLDLRSPVVRAKAAGGFSRELLSDPSLWATDRRVVEIVPDAPHRSRVKLLPA